MERIKVLIVDNDVFTLEGISQYLALEGFSVYKADDKATAWEIAQAERPQAGVVDIVIPDLPGGKAAPESTAGLRLARQLKQAYPEMGVVLFSAYREYRSVILEMIQDGVVGIAYKLKGCQAKDILHALNDTLAGRIVIDPEITAPRSLAVDLLNQLTPEERPWVERARGNLSTLSQREHETALRIAASQGLEGIAKALGVTPKSIENYTTRIYNKLGLSEIEQDRACLRAVVILAKAILIDSLIKQSTIL
jgi:DNA-binding NarL/FixJ family response regulator